MEAEARAYLRRCRGEWARCRRDIGEMEARWRRDLGEMEAEARAYEPTRSLGEIQARYRRDIGRYREI